MATPVGGYQQGGWYEGRQYWNGQLGAPGVIMDPSAVGSGQTVSSEVLAQTSRAAGLAPGANQAYLQQQTGGQYVPGGGQPTQGTGAFGTTGRPTIDLQSVYDTAYKSPEIAASEKAVADAQVKIDEQTKAFNEATAIINDNPFYSEATRVGKIRQLQEKYNADIIQFQNAKALATDDLAKKQADAQVKVNIAMQQYDIDNTAYQNTLSQFNAALSAGALINANGSDIAQYAQLTGMSTTMIENIIAQQKREQIKPQIITSTDDNGKVTLTAVDANTGNIINQTSLGSIGNRQTGAKASASDKKEYYAQALREDAQKGISIDQAFSLYTGYLEPDDIYRLYNANSKAGPTTKTPKELQSYGVSQPGAVSTNQMLLDLLSQNNQ